MQQHATHYRALVGFLFLALACTFPVVLDLGSALMGLGDTLLNSWILAWETHSLFGPDRVGFFDTNIFYPHRNTLAYSEFLIPQLLVAAPVMLWSGNPVLAHNVVLLLSLVITAMGAYLLAYRITRNRSASFAAGLILAFCPFMFSHLVHIQILFAGGIPLTFLFLFRWLESGKAFDAVMLGLFYAIQALANAYYAVYLAFFAGIVLLAQILRRRSWSSRRFWLQLILAALVAAVLMGPFYLRYIQLQQEMGFQRVLPPPTQPGAYLAAPAFNRLYGGLSRVLGSQEGYLFPGFVATALALIGIFQWARPSVTDMGSKASSSRDRSSSWWRFRVVDGLLIATATLSLLLAMGWSVDTRLGSLPLRITSMRNPLILLILFLAVRIWMQRRWPGHSRSWGLPTAGWTYPLLLLSAFVLSLGTAPYHLLYRWVPGFSSLRAIPRIHVMFMFALAIMAAQGTAFLLGRATGVRRRMLAVILPALILCEYFSAPLPVVAAPAPDEFPAVEQWIADQDRELVYVAYPLRISDNIHRLYYSTRHWRGMVNGFSGFIPPLYSELESRGRFVPDPQTVRALQDLGVDLLLIDTERYREPRRRRLRSNLAELSELEEIAVFDGTIVYRIRSGTPQPQPSASLRASLQPLNPSGFHLNASFDQESLNKILDGDQRTLWRSPMVPGEWIEIGLDEPQSVAALELDISGFPHDYPRGYRLETSVDGNQWQTLAQDPEFLPSITDFVHPNHFVLSFEWPPTRARYVRFVQTGEADRHPWTVVEMAILGPPS